MYLEMVLTDLIFWNIKQMFSSKFLNFSQIASSSYSFKYPIWLAFKNCIT